MNKNSAGTGGRRPTVLVLTSTFPRWVDDDQPAFVFELCHRLSGGFNVSVLAPHTAGAKCAEKMKDMDVRRFRYAPVRFENLAYGAGMLSRLKDNRLRLFLLPFFAIAQVVAIVRLIREKKFDVIHAHWIVPQGFSAVLARMLAGSRIPIVCTSHGGDLYALRGRLWTAIKRAVLKRVDAVTVVSTAMAQEVSRLIPGHDEPIVAPMGTDLSNRFVPSSIGIRNENQLLFVGRLVPKKGVDFLIRVLGRLACQTGRRPELRIVGSGPELDVLVRLAREEGVEDQIEFYGFCSHDRLPALYQRCGIAVFPFRQDAGGDQEGFGLVVVEALGCACPVMASNLSPLRDTIGNGAHIVALPPLDLDAWVAAIDRVLGNPASAREMGAAGRIWVHERFDWSVSANHYARLLEDRVRA